nr:hypothetical protein [Streptomyces sp. NRRL S-1813]
MPRRQTLHEQSRRRPRAHARWHGDQIAVGGNRLGGVATLLDVAEHPPAVRGPADDLHAGDVRQRALRRVRTVGVLARHALDVAEVDARGLHFDQGLARSRHRVRHLGLRQDFRITEPLELHGTHERPSQA